jgi:hypothetical protein
MKKLVVTTLCVVSLVLGLSLVACQKKETVTEKPSRLNKPNNQSRVNKRQLSPVVTVNKNPLKPAVTGNNRKGNPAISDR